MERGRLHRGSENEQHRDRRPDGDVEVVGKHRRPREVEGKDEQEKRRDHGARTAPETVPEHVDEQDADRRHSRDGKDQTDLVEPEYPAAEYGRQPPGDAVGGVVGGNDSPVDYRRDVVVEVDVVAEAVAAEVEETEGEPEAR